MVCILISQSPKKRLKPAGCTSTGKVAKRKRDGHLSQVMFLMFQLHRNQRQGIHALNVLVKRSRLGSGK